MPFSCALSSYSGHFRVYCAPRRRPRPIRQNVESPMSATATAPEQAPNCLAGFVPVQVRTLRLTKTDAADLFVQYEPNAEPVLYCRAGSHPDDQQFAELAEGGVESLYVRDDDFCSISNDVLAKLDSVVEQKNIRP